MKNKQLKNILLTSAAAIVVSLTPTHTVHAAEGAVEVMAYETFQPMVTNSISFFLDACSSITENATVLGVDEMTAIKFQWEGGLIHATGLSELLEGCAIRNMWNLSDEISKFIFSFELFLLSKPDLGEFNGFMNILGDILLSVQIR